jgi:hypothetical protein
MKTIQEYMNDPRLLNDPGIAGALEPVREIHAARLMIQDETAGMTAAQKSEDLKKNTLAVCQYGASPSANCQPFRPRQIEIPDGGYPVRIVPGKTPAHYKTYQVGGLEGGRYRGRDVRGVREFHRAKPY